MVFILIKWGGLVATPFYNTLSCFSWFSLIRARNYASFVLLDSLLYEEFSEKKFQNFSQFVGLVENRLNRLCKTTHGQPPILACFKPEYIMACSHLLQGTCRPTLGSKFSFGLNKVG